MAQTSGTYAWAPSLGDFVREAYERIQIYPPQLTIEHVVSARQSMNFILSEWSGDRGINLFAVDQINIPLIPGRAQFPLPPETVEILDVYLRYFTPNGPVFTIGNTLTPLGPAGNPLVSQPFGDPLLIGPSSSVLSCTAGSQLMTMNWPSHGLYAGQPFFWGCTTSIGGIILPAFGIVNTVLDGDTFQFYSPTVALESQTNQGATPLFSTTLGSPNVDVILPGHGLSVGSTFPIQINTTVGGLALVNTATYTVVSVQSLYEFTFDPGLGNATSTASVFENLGQMTMTTQTTSPSGGYEPTDIILFPLSRNDYAAIPQKFVPGRPTSFWFNRQYPPNFSIYPVTPPFAPIVQNPPVPPLPPSFYYGFQAYRLRQIQDANPINGQVPDLPPRAFQAFASACAAALSEKWKPELHQAKIAIAEAAWDRFASNDVEHATLSIKPALQGYFR